MDKIYNEKYFNRRNYILEHLTDYHLSSQEAIIILLIDFNNEFKQINTSESITKMSGIDLDTVNNAIVELCKKGYMEIITKRGVTNFSINPLFEKKQSNNSICPDDIFELFTSEFGRPLNQNETIKLGEWLRKYTFEQLVDALKNASIYKKYSFTYIEKILANNE